MKILFTICARAGSKGLKNKNVSDFLEIPLSYYTLSAYKLFCNKNTQYKCALAVNTDSPKLIEQIKRTNIEFTHIQRIEELAGDRVGKIDVIKDTFKKMGQDFDVVIDLDLTSPLRTVEDIEGVLKGLVDNSKADVCFSMTEARRSPYFNQVKKGYEGFYTTVLNSQAVSRQEVEEVFDMNASIYAYKPEYLSREDVKKLFDGKMTAYKMKDTAVLDIDNPGDKELMEIIATYFYKKYQNYNEVKTFCDTIVK